jgi:hypothetical protein
MLAMVSRTPRGIRQPASSLTTIASVLAPTGIGDRCDIQVGWQAAFAGKPAPTMVVGVHTMSVSPRDL